MADFVVLGLLGQGAAAAATAPGIVERLIAPTPPHEFFASIYEQTWAYFPHNETPLLPRQRVSLEDVTRWAAKGLRYGQSLEVLGHPITGKSLSTPKKGETVLGSLHRAFSKGHSMVLNSLQSFSEPAHHLVSDLVDDLSWPIDAYMYLTPPFSKSYGLHLDVMDAWMVQVHGSKAWTLCNPRGFIQDEGRREKEMQCENLTMQGGDVMYIPFGTYHRAITNEDLSAHLTINIERQCYVWGNILQAALVHALHLQGGQAGRATSPADYISGGGFQMEGEEPFERWVLAQMRHAPMLRRVPLAAHPAGWGTALPRSLGNRDLPAGYLEALAEEWRLLVGELEGLSGRPPKVNWGGRSKPFDLKAINDASLRFALEAARVHSIQHLNGDVVFPVSALASLSTLRRLRVGAPDGSAAKAAASVRFRRAPRARAVLAEDFGPPQLWLNVQRPSNAEHVDAVLFCLGQFSPKSSRGEAFDLASVPWSGSDKERHEFVLGLIKEGALEVVADSPADSPTDSPADSLAD